MGGALPAYLGGRSLELADIDTHLPVNYMRISKDMQPIVSHTAMQWLSCIR